MFNSSHILKNFLIIITLVFLASCKSKLNKADSTKISEPTPASLEQNSQDNYQTIKDEQQAEQLDRQVQAQAEEIEVQDRVFFGYDSSDVNDEAKKILTTQADWLKSDRSIKVTIEGHCDERGTREYNIALGEKRANSVKRFLVANGVEASRIKVVSYGKERPAFFGNRDESFAKNRRAVTVVNN